MHTLHNGDALEWMKSLPAASVDCVFVDLPYFGVVSDDWDNQWKDRNEYLDWVVSLAHEWKRITKNNSSIFVFCDEKMEAYIQVRLDEIFLLLNKIVWYRKTNEMKKFAQNFRTFAPSTERALFYTTQQDVTGLVSIMPIIMEKFQKYFSDVIPLKDWNKVAKSLSVSNTAVRHWVNYPTQPSLPNKKNYERLQVLYPQLHKSYDEISKEYEALRLEHEALRRPFNADNKTFDVLEFPAYDDSAGILEHATPKPVSLCRRIISVITNPDQVVLDCCMGLGSAGVAAVELGRHFLGCDNDPKYFSIAQARIKKAAQSPSFNTLPNNRLQPTAFGVGTQAQFPLLGGTQAEESSAKHGGG